VSPEVGGIRSLSVPAAPHSPDRYGPDVLAGDWRAPKRGRSSDLAAEQGLVVEDVETGWVGAVVRVEKSGGMHVVHLEDRRGRVKGFPLGPGFLIDGRPVTLTRPVAASAARLDEARRAASRTASGSVAVHGATARVASGSRIYVEGRHDAELVEKVWGDDLRIEGVVVEMMDGVDDLAGIIAEFQPGPDRRLGVLVDHLVPGTKEARIVGARPAGARQAREDPRTPVCRRVAVGAARAARLAAVAGHPPRHVVEARHLRDPRLAP
jgi:hypothetical protein